MRQIFLYAISTCLIGLFWRQGLASLGNFGRRWADKLGGPAP